MRNLTIESGVTTINRFVFQAAVNLEYVLIPASVKKIGMQAFMGCTNLKELVMESTSILDLDIESEAFSGCISLGCDSVKAVDSVAELLLSKSILESSFEHCPSLAFTPGIVSQFCGALICESLQSE